MTTTRTAIGRVPGAGRAVTPRRTDARLAPGGPNGPPERDAPATGRPPAGRAARWQLILDLLDPDNRCGAWSPTTLRGRPVVCTRAPHHVREEHANAEPGGAGTTNRPHRIPDGAPDRAVVLDDRQAAEPGQQM